MRKILTAIIVVLVIVGGWLLFYQKGVKKTVLTPTPTTSAVTITPVPTVTLTKKYITPVNWPPKITTENRPFSCINAGTQESATGQTQKIVVNSHTYCVTKQSQGAAGSIYTQYAYAKAFNNQTQIFIFTLRFVQCGNYSDPQKLACEKERSTFNVDSFMDQYIQSKL